MAVGKFEQGSAELESENLAAAPETSAANAPAVIQGLSFDQIRELKLNIAAEKMHQKHMPH